MTDSLTYVFRPPKGKSRKQPNPTSSKTKSRSKKSVSPPREEEKRVNLVKTRSKMQNKTDEGDEQIELPQKEVVAQQDDENNKRKRLPTRSNQRMKENGSSKSNKKQADVPKESAKKIDTTDIVRDSEVSVSAESTSKQPAKSAIKLNLGNFQKIEKFPKINENDVSPIYDESATRTTSSGRRKKPSVSIKMQQNSTNS